MQGAELTQSRHSTNNDAAVVDAGAIRARGSASAAMALLCAAALAALILGIHAANPRTLCSTHGLLHAAIVQRCERGGLPPENPFFAGRPVCYYWFFQYIGSAIVGVTGADPLHALE